MTCQQVFPPYISSVTITERLRVPPYAYGLLACVGERPMTTAELSARSGLPAKTVTWLRRKQAWGDVPISVADRFIMGCGYDPLRQKEALRKLRRWLTEIGLENVRHLRQRREMTPPERVLRIRQAKRLRVILEQ